MNDIVVADGCDFEHIYGGAPFAEFVSGDVASPGASCSGAAVAVKSSVSLSDSGGVYSLESSLEGSLEGIIRHLQARWGGAEGG